MDYQHCESCGRTWEYTPIKNMCPRCIIKTKVIRGNHMYVQTDITDNQLNQFNKRFDEMRNRLLESMGRK